MPLSGDEDVRVGVQIAQNYGVRVHLLGIVPSRGSQSKALLQEADTTTEWDRSVVATFLSVRPAIPTPIIPGPVSGAAGATVMTESTSVRARPFDRLASELVDGLSETEILGVFSFWTARRGVPQEFDARLLGACRSALGRDLTLPERREARECFSEAVRRRRKNP